MRISVLILLSTCFFFSCKKNNPDEQQQTTVQTPIALPATEINYSYLTANWSSPLNNDSIHVFVAADTNFIQPIKDFNPYSTGGSETPIIGLQPNTKYFYRVKAFFGGKASGLSNIISVTTKNWDGQLSFNGTTSNIITSSGISGSAKYVDLSNAPDYTYTVKLIIMNVPEMSSGTYAIKDSPVDYMDISATLFIGGAINNIRYNSKQGGTITKTGLKSFTFSCPVYLDKDVTKATVYTLTGTCKY